MEKKRLLPLLACLVLLTACGPKEAAAESPAPTPAMTAAPGPTPSQVGEATPELPVEPPAQTAEPISEPTPEPLRVVGTLAGFELNSALFLRDAGENDFAQDESAGLDERFQALGFDADAPFYEYWNGDGNIQLRLWYDAASGSGVGLHFDYWGPTPEICGFGFEETVKAEEDRSGIPWSHWEKEADDWSYLLENALDDRGRTQYERCYITHGTLEYYYIYDGEAAEPSYCLWLDDNLGQFFPELIRF